MISRQGPEFSSAWHRWQRKSAPYLFIAPFYIFFAVFMALPVASAISLSLSNAAGLKEPAFVGLNNFRYLLADKIFRTSLLNTLVYSAASLFICLPLSLLLAVVLNSSLVPGKRFFRTVFFIPNITAIVVVGITFVLVYDYHFGVLNYVLVLFGLQPLHWLSDAILAKVSIIGLILWRYVGFVMVYFLAGLQNIPQSVYEAAYVDGASPRQAFWHITIPLLRPVVLFVVVITTIGSLQIFTEPYILTAGGPANATLSLAQYLYRVGFQYVRYGYASAVGVVLGAIIFVLSVLQLRLLRVFVED